MRTRISSAQMLHGELHATESRCDPWRRIAYDSLRVLRCAQIIGLGW
jgi:hypothetical protein